MEYSQKLKDPRWQRKRLERFQDADFRCSQCSSRKDELHLHHCWYESRKEPWDYPDDCFRVLCGKCHEQWHRTKLSIDKAIASFGSMDMDRLKGLLFGMVCSTDYRDMQIGPHMDALTIAAFVRGFWVPSRFIDDVLNRCLSRVANGETFLFSEVISETIPDEPKLQFMHAWVESVRQECADV